MHVHCPKCHSENPDISRFCGSCAAALAREGPLPPSLKRAIQAPSSSAAAGPLITGKYRILDEIGRGGMKPFWKCFLIIGIVLVAFVTLGAQQTGEIRGKVTDEKGEALPGVAITAKSPSLQWLRTALSDRGGNFRLLILPVGIYSISFELAGFEKLEITSQDIRLGFTEYITPVLKSVAVTEEVIVVAPAPLIDKTKADNSYRVNSDELARVPAQSRTIAKMVGLTPGVTGVSVCKIPLPSQIIDVPKFVPRYVKQIDALTQLIFFDNLGLLHRGDGT